MNEVVKFEDEIIKELKDLYGARELKETLINYIEYIHLREKGKIDDLGNYNIFIIVPPFCTYTDKIIDVVYKILKYSNIIKTDYHKITEDELKQNTNDITADLIILEPKIFNLRFAVDTIQKFMQNNPTKKYIAFCDLDRKALGDKYELDEYLMPNFTFNTKIIRVWADFERKKYIIEKLKNQNISIDENTNLVHELQQEKDMKIIDKELLYLIVKCKTTETDIITNSFLENINRRQYVNNTIDTKENSKSALEELQEMVGLEDVKIQVKQILNYIRINKIRGQLPMLHMAFLGNPGSGKTEVARLIGRIFQEEKILRKGTFIEVSRSDLVGQYIGQTEARTRDFIEKAKGGILYIDEAYNLDPKDSTKDYGHQVISTLIKYMEDYRENLCVILSGYTEDMKNLLKANRGFESRINFKINFKDYNAEELYQIFKIMTKKEAYKVESSIKKELLPHFETAITKENFSNGRYVRNLFERVKFAQADRVSEDKKADKNLIKRCDIKVVIDKLQQEQDTQKRKIGF